MSGEFFVFIGLIALALVGMIGAYSYGYRRREKGISQWSKKPITKLSIIAVLLLTPFLADAATRTVSWTAVTQYTDGSTIETANTPVTYDVWYVTPGGVKVTVATGTSATSATFSDSGMTKGTTYNFYGKAYTKDGSASADSTAYGWTVPFQIPKAPTGVTVSP